MSDYLEDLDLPDDDDEDETCELHWLDELLDDTKGERNEQEKYLLDETLDGFR